MMHSFAFLLIQVPESSHAAWMGWHCMIHMTVKMVLEKSRNATAHCSGKRSALLLGNRIKNRHMETLVHIRVANVWIHSP